MTDKSDRVKELLDNPYMQEAFENVRNRYLAMFENAPVNGSEENLTLMLDIKKMLQALNDVEADLRNEVANGSLEDFRAEQERQPAFLGDLHGRKAI